MRQNYFFIVYDSSGGGKLQNPLPNISGTWKLYCTEVVYQRGQSLNMNDFTLIQQGNFTTDSNGGFEYNSGNPIIVSTDYNTFLIVLEVEGYRKSFRIYPWEFNLEPKKTLELNTDNFNQIGRFEKGEVPTNYSFRFLLFTETEWIEFKILKLRDSLSNRFTS